MDNADIGKMANIYRQMYRAFIIEGFTEEQAMCLLVETIRWNGLQNG